jgi:Family of unknown function (DUF6152)
VFPYDPRSVNAALMRPCKIIGIEDLGFHDFRHKATSRLFERGSGISRSLRLHDAHTWVRLMVEQDGNQVECGVEGGNPTRRRQVNLVPGVLNTGDKVTIRVHPLRDGRKGGSFIDVVLPNGETRKPL